jgi:hypothetical protein
MRVVILQQGEGHQITIQLSKKIEKITIEELHYILGNLNKVLKDPDKYSFRYTCNLHKK